MVHRLLNLTKEKMKKILYSIFALSTILFTATSCTEDNGTTTEVEDSNDDENVDPSHIRGYGDREPGGVPPSSPEADQMYGFSTEELNNQLVTDLGVDANLASEIVRVYYDRSAQLSEMQRAIEEKGQTQINDADRQRLDTESDERIRKMLDQDQYRKYEQNRAKYNQMIQNKNNTTGSDM